MNFINENVWLIFFIATIVFLIVEIFTTDLTALMFATGSFVGSLLAFFGAPLLAVLAVAITIALLLFLYARPPLRARMEASIPDEKFGVDILIGEICIAKNHDKVEVDLRGTEIWSAKSVDKTPLVPGEHYLIEQILSSSLLVTPLNKQ